MWVSKTNKIEQQGFHPAALRFPHFSAQILLYHFLMPRGFVDDPEGDVADEEVDDGSFGDDISARVI